MQIDTKVDIVVPCYNPPVNWHTDLLQSFELFSSSIAAESTLILVNDGSTEVVSQEQIDFLQQRIPNFTYVHYDENKGKGHALRVGIKHAKSPLVITTDIDFPYENKSMVEAFEALKNKGGLVLGYRKGDYYRKVPLFRKMLSVSFRLALKILLNLNVNDTQCGLKGFSPEACEVFLHTEINGYLYDLELVREAQAQKIPIHRVSVQLKSGVEFTNMKMSILIRESRNFLKILLNR